MLNLLRRPAVTPAELDEGLRALGLDGSQHVIVHASLHEAFCSVIIESMALGRPLVATDIAAAPEQVDDGESGLLVPARDGVTLAAAVVKLLEQPQWAAELGEEAQRRVRDRFNFPRMMQLYESIYDELLGRC